MVNKYIIVLIIAFSVFLQGGDNEFILPYIEEYQLDNGMRVLISPNYESPVVYINMWIDVGEIDDPIGKPDLGNAVFEELKEGTIKYPDKNQLKEKLFSLGNNSGEMETIDLPNDEGIVEHICLKENTLDCIEIVAEVIKNPTFPLRNILAKKLAILFAGKKLFANRWNSTWHHAQNLYNNKIERSSPKYKLSYNKNDYRSWYSQYIRPENITLMVSGDVNYIYIKKIINEYFGDWENNSPMPNRRVYNINITDESGIDVRFIPFEDKDKTIIRILKKTTELDQFWDPSVQMALYVFGEIGNSRKHKIHQNLDKAGGIWIYWSQSNRMPYVRIDAEMKHSYLEKFYSELISEFRNLTNNSISKEELELAKATRINDYQNKTYNPKELNGFIQHYYNRNGYSLEKISTMINDINAVTIEDVNAAAKKIFDPNNFVMAIAGNKDSCAIFLDQFPNIEYYEKAEEIRASASSP